MVADLDRLLTVRHLTPWELYLRSILMSKVRNTQVFSSNLKQDKRHLFFKEAVQVVSGKFDRCSGRQPPHVRARCDPSSTSPRSAY
jgi:hypothetical protein